MAYIIPSYFDYKGQVAIPAALIAEVIGDDWHLYNGAALEDKIDALGPFVARRLGIR